MKEAEVVPAGVNSKQWVRPFRSFLINCRGMCLGMSAGDKVHRIVIDIVKDFLRAGKTELF